MIKFFRKIRQRLITENKFSKYLIYAIGEIILVVIGILIALQINTWNESSYTNSLSKTYLNNIKKDLIADTTTFRSGIDRIEKDLIKQENLFNPDKVDKLPADSLIPSISSSFHSSRIYRINNSTYLKTTNVGFVESKMFKEIYTHINQYYTKEYSVWNQYLIWEEETGMNIYSPESLGKWYDKIDLIDLAKTDNPEFHTNEKNLYEKVFREYLKSPRFRNYAWDNNEISKVIRDRMKYQKKIATELIEKINIELNK